MKGNKKLRPILAIVALVFVIADPETAKIATVDGIELCIYTVLPGILVFLFISSLISSDLIGLSIPFLERLLSIPPGTSGYFIVGQLCGYPVGAKLLHDAYSNGSISKNDSMRMICFCNNASPAFIIGILGALFQNHTCGIVMWLIQILASFILAILTRTTSGQTTLPYEPITQKRLQITDVIQTAAGICGWIIVFKIMLGYLDKGIAGIIDGLPKTLLWGIGELTNGLMALHTVNSEPIRFVVSGFFLSFGGLCVLQQTRSVAPQLPIMQYVISRILHSGISCVLASVFSHFLFKECAADFQIPALYAAATVVCYMIFHFNQNNGSVQKEFVV